ncbi:bifunctional DNA-formamidopyrimidine glycosylase/DNA-(apurinic or apyrimidinic site) lyase [Ehrlichia ruminantium]|uniref:Formamidopyrimidine-DNA glycosylase n=1 Tax=Ehrlichia ruminantium TaxID=779 RepID=A0AAE6QAD5_EHRRU|nr:bifunctional DNA-formamidopyrimidine glycosylase/DNA-(apurinic or apyrimidinic site) lyase [Ehrlichia ruminantium]QGR03427.1 bifunctional DNA-formamidopyrimidine glycosylase/DNA-(apurinic or apyrimidinic site) lyase [Ehrlichia ruminantium]QGR04341.1 bifunctional DNA-formamidopyrimidine glycosylase/DNA-(apurinic or apyrimidinic site) lyase [Ehrlichia ruminantium]
MPELPEVEIVCRMLSNEILGKTILKVQINRYDLRTQITKNLDEVIQGHYISKIIRKGKYIVFILSNQYYVIIHLGMSGTLLCDHNYATAKHNHVLFFLSDNKLLIFNDPRRFGLITLLNHKQYLEFFKDFGVDPLSDNFNTEYLYSYFNRKTTIKSLLMNNKIVSGIGNIYAIEGLFTAKVLPTRLTTNISFVECKAIIQSVKNILLLSITHGGSSIKDYRSPTGIKGNFQNYFSVYNRAGQLCYICNNQIAIIKQHGRSTFLCYKCQF